MPYSVQTHMRHLYLAAASLPSHRLRLHAAASVSGPPFRLHATMSLPRHLFRCHAMMSLPCRRPRRLALMLSGGRKNLPAGSHRSAAVRFGADIPTHSCTLRTTFVPPRNLRRSEVSASPHDIPEIHPGNPQVSPADDRTDPWRVLPCSGTAAQRTGFRRRDLPPLQYGTPPDNTYNKFRLPPDWCDNSGSLLLLIHLRLLHFPYALPLSALL